MSGIQAARRPRAATGRTGPISWLTERSHQVTPSATPRCYQSNPISEIFPLSRPLSTGSRSANLRQLRCNPRGVTCHLPADAEGSVGMLLAQRTSDGSHRCSTGRSRRSGLAAEPTLLRWAYREFLGCSLPRFRSAAKLRCSTTAKKVTPTKVPASSSHKKIWQLDGFAKHAGCYDFPDNNEQTPRDQYSNKALPKRLVPARKEMHKPLLSTTSSKPPQVNIRLRLPSL